MKKAAKVIIWATVIWLLFLSVTRIASIIAKYEIYIKTDWAVAVVGAACVGNGNSDRNRKKRTISRILQSSAYSDGPCLNREHISVDIAKRKYSGNIWRGGNGHMLPVRGNTGRFATEIRYPRFADFVADCGSAVYLCVFYRYAEEFW